MGPNVLKVERARILRVRQARPLESLVDLMDHFAARLSLPILIRPPAHSRYDLPTQRMRNETGAFGQCHTALQELGEGPSFIPSRAQQFQRNRNDAAQNHMTKREYSIMLLTIPAAVRFRFTLKMMARAAGPGLA